MKKAIAIMLTLTTLAIGSAIAEVCTEQAAWCGTIVGVTAPEGGTCHGNSHDKMANVVAYDANGNICDSQTHVCGIGPC